MIVVDVCNLAHRALHTTGALMHAGRYTGVLFGLWKQCVSLEHTFEQPLAFCFDSRNLDNRKAIYPEYKTSRAAKHALEDPDLQDMRAGMHQQIRDFWALLPEMGCENVYGVKGYEADDLMASIAMHNKKVILVSNDEDLYQLLDYCDIWKPGRKILYTQKHLMDDTGLMPGQWASCKAWAGCTSDGIPGLKGVGMKTAAKYLLGKWKRPEQFTDHIETYNRNIQLVRLPFPGTPTIILKPQKKTLNWKVLSDFIGSDELPLGTKR